MKRLGQLTIIMLALGLHGCTVAYYSLQNKVESATSENHSCDVKYSISVTSGRYTNTHGLREAARERLHQMKSQYITATDEILHNKGCKTTYVEEDDDATFEVHVDNQTYISALPQEWLTGLSFGLIPSWGTRKSEYVYRFINKTTGKSHNYTVDQKSYNHLILFPIFWVSFFTLDDSGVYKEALTNFLMHN